MVGQGQDYNGLLLLAALLSIQIARDLTNDELAVLAAFFVILGDNLTLLALRSEPSSANNTSCN